MTAVTVAGTEAEEGVCLLYVQLWTELLGRDQAAFSPGAVQRTEMPEWSGKCTEPMKLEHSKGGAQGTSWLVSECSPKDGWI